MGVFYLCLHLLLILLIGLHVLLGLISITRGSIKGQVFANFVVELSSEVAQNSEGDFG